jgi:hypothetical protein
MARQNSATIDGLFVGYGVRDTITAEQTNVHTKGRIREAVVEIDYRNITGFAGGTAASKKDFGIPVGAQIISSQLYIVTGFNTLTSIVIGTKQLAGTAISASGLHASTLLAAINTAGMTEEGAGALVGGVASTLVQYVSLDVTGSAPTAGHGILTVRYYEPVASQIPPAVLVGVQ